MKFVAVECGMDHWYGLKFTWKHEVPVYCVEPLERNGHKHSNRKANGAKDKVFDNLDDLPVVGADDFQNVIEGRQSKQARLDGDIHVRQIFPLTHKLFPPRILGVEFVIDSTLMLHKQHVVGNHQ